MGFLYMTGTTEIDGGVITATEAKTDYQVQIPLGPAVFSAGTWTATESSNVVLITRTAATQTDYYTLPIIMPFRTTADKGAKLKSVTVVATLGGTLSTTNDDFEVNIFQVTTPVDASTPVGSVLAGDDTADYDTDHNTKAKRLVSATHTIVVTIPTLEQDYIDSGEQLYVRIKVTDAGSADLTFVLKGAVAAFDVNSL
jgi:hypothetical protein